MANVDKLFKIRNSFDYSEENDSLFVESMKEMILFHREHSRIFNGICEQYGFDLNKYEDIDDVLNTPHIMVTAFKERKILSVDESEIVQTFTSSGTSGSMSQTNWDEISKSRQEFTREAIVDTYGLLSDKEVNYICFSYSPKISGNKGAAHTHSAYTGFAPAKEIFYAIDRDSNGKDVFLIEQCQQALERFYNSGLPLRITGFPAFAYITLKKLFENGVKYNFPEDSVMFSGGGWKLYSGEEVSMDEYSAMVKEVLGIDRSRIRDVFGMVEHGIPYITCEHGNFHVPIYARVCAVDPYTMKILPDGEKGLLKLITPYIRSVPAISVLSTDWAETRSKCSCGRKGKYIVLKGRAGVKKYSGCAISATQILGQ